MRSYQVSAILHAVSLSIHLFPPKAVHQKPSKVEHETFICNSENLNKRPTPRVTHLRNTTQYPLIFEYPKIINAYKWCEIGEFGLPKIRFLCSFSCLTFLLLNLSSSHNQPCQIPLSTAGLRAARGSWSMHPPAAVKIGVLQRVCFFDILPSGKVTLLWKITIFNGKTHYFDWAIFNSFLYVYQRLIQDTMKRIHFLWSLQVWPKLQQQPVLIVLGLINIHKYRYKKYRNKSKSGWIWIHIYSVIHI